MRYFPSIPTELDHLLLAEGDVVVAMDRPWVAAGLKFAVIRSSDLPCVLVQRVARLRSRPGLDQRFLGYLIADQGFVSHVLSVQTGSTIPHISSGQIGEFRIKRLPPIEEQRGIAATLGALDDKIESNRRAISRMEELGSALLNRIVVPDVYGFPEYSDETLGDQLKLIETGSRPKGGVAGIKQGVLSLGAQHIQSAGMIPADLRTYVPDEFAARMNRGVLDDGDVLVYKDGGKPGNFIPHVSAFGSGFPTHEAVINEHVYRVRAADPISQGLLYWLLRSQWMDAEMRKRGTGVAIPGLNRTNFLDLPWPTITAEQVAELNTSLDPMLHAMLRLGRENQRLEALRDALLPELLSGRLRVPEARELVA